MKSTHRPPLAVVGVSALFPGSSDATGFWRDILAGADLLGDIPPSHWLVEDYFDPDPKARDKTYARRGGFLDPVDFDPVQWGVPPTILKATDSSQLLGLIVAERVLRDATREQFTTVDRSRMSVILGVTSAQELLAAMVSRLQRPVWVKALREQGLPEDEVQAACDRIAAHYVEWEESSFPGLLGNVVAGRIANRLNLGGTNCVTDAACASTFSALSMAAQELYLGDSDLVITGGVDTLNEIFMFMCFSKTPALSMSGDCRPFSDKADGTMLGEGLGMVALRRLEDAERDGDRVYAVVRGIGSSSDGRSKSVYAPLPAGQAKALGRAYERAGFGPETVELLEAHGTGTKAGDLAEFTGLNMVFKTDDAGARQWCALGSVKSQIGHAKAAAGAAGLFKAVMALHHKVLPPTAKVDKPNPKLGLEESAFYLNTRARPWIRPDAHPRRAGVSAFGFGGSNFHVALEEYTGAAPRPERLRTARSELITISAASASSLVAEARARVELLRAHAGAPELLAFVARDLQRRFDAGAAHRLALVAADAETLAARLARAAERIERAPQTSFELPDGACYGVGAPTARAVGFLFPGQGSQYVGMGAELAMNDDDARAVWDRAASLSFASEPGARVHQVVFPPPRFSDDARAADQARLQATRWAQPAIGCTSLALLAVLRRLGVSPQAVAGHSFGELTALRAAGALREDDFLRAARRRGELMEEVGGDAGAMTAVSADVESVRAAVDGHDVVLANHNAPEQVVISGATIDVERAERALAGRGLRFTRLPVAAAFHSPVVAPSTVPFARFLSDLPVQTATIPVYSGETARPYAPGAEAVRARLSGQIAAPVRFVEMVTAMADAGVDTFVEVGPGSTLTGLVGRILGSRSHLAVALDRKGVDGLESLCRALARLSAGGLALELGALWRGYREPRDPAARRKPRLAVPISGTNHGKLYPPPGGAAALPPPNPPRPTRDRSARASTERAAAPTAIVAAAPTPDHAPRTVTSAPAPAASSWIAPAPARAPTSAASMSSTSSTTDVPSTPSARMASSDAWLAAWREAQEQTARAHAVFQESMAQSHAAYLRAAEAGLGGLASLAGAAPVQLSPAPLVQLAAPQPTRAVAVEPSSRVPTPTRAAPAPSLDPVDVDPTPAVERAAPERVTSSAPAVLAAAAPG
ncbi:MAG: acyltransferase domain-containing protein, partial [Myxococcales bacterium]|nr:acyltransferase domain-containing protein [Myxococcales bacterium]